MILNLDRNDVNTLQTALLALQTGFEYDAQNRMNSRKKRQLAIKSAGLWRDLLEKISMQATAYDREQAKRGDSA